MSYIACTAKCIYQVDGSCTLDIAAGVDDNDEFCVNFIPRNA